MEERGSPAGLRQAPRERRSKRGRAAPIEGETHMLGSPQASSIYRGRGGGCAPSRVPSPGVAAAPRWHLVRPEGGEGGRAPRVGLRAHLPYGLPPSPTSLRLGPCGGAHQPTWVWSPPTLGPCSPPGLVAPLGGPPGPSRWSRYITDKTRNFSGDQNKTSHI